MYRWQSWSIHKKLGGRRPPIRETYRTSPDQIVSRKVALARGARDKYHIQQLTKGLRALWLKLLLDTAFSYIFSIKELMAVLKELKSSKTPGFGRIYPEFLLHCQQKTREGVATFYPLILTSGNKPNAFQTNIIIIILKQGKPHFKVESYRQIVHLSCC